MADVDEPSRKDVTSSPHHRLLRFEVARDVPPRVDLLDVAARTEAGVKIDPADASAEGAVLTQDRAQNHVTPGCADAAVEEPVRKLALAAGHRLLQRLGAVARHVRAQLRFVLRGRRPRGGDDERVHFGVRRVGGRRRGKIAEIAIHVDVVFISPVQMREPERVQRMHEDDDHTRRARRGDEFGVVQQADLAAGAAESLDAMCPRDEHEHRRSRRVAQHRYIEREFLACRSSRRRMDVPRHGEVERLGRGEEFVACLDVRAGKVAEWIHRYFASGMAVSANAAR